MLILQEEAGTWALSSKTQVLLENKTSTWSCTVRCLLILEIHFPQMSRAPAYNDWKLPKSSQGQSLINFSYPATPHLSL